jgi:dolichyl-phosphate beta-glucosyltransferase
VSIQHPTISVVLPAFNEAARLPPFLETVRRWLQGRYDDRHEVIVVDDGSFDGLADLLARRETEWTQLRVIRHPENRGKGAAVRTGMLAASGDLLLFADADGATPIEEASRLAAAIAAGADVAVGSRLMAGPGAARSRQWFRGLAGRAFAAVARLMLRLPVRDTQCGFKMFRRDAGRRLFSLARETGYLFDLEILALARQLGYRVVEVPVSWTEKSGGHFHPARELPKVLAALWRLRRRRDVSPAPQPVPGPPPDSASGPVQPGRSS